MRTTAAIAVLLAAAAYAACPNSCSGHGTCNEVDRCICFKQSNGRGGLRDMYTGYDCSERVCPYGKAFDALQTAGQSFETPNVGYVSKAGDMWEDGMETFVTDGLRVEFDFNFEVEVVSYDNAASPYPLVFKYKRDTDRLWSQPQTVNLATDADAGSSKANAFELMTKVNGRNKRTGVYIFFKEQGTITDFPQVGDKWYANVTYNSGDRFMASDGNSAHQLIECSGRGTCERSSGTCQCYDGFTGDSCGRTVCPDDCSGHGVCQSLQRMSKQVSQAGYTGYTSAFDSSSYYGCKCDVGFRGNSCSDIECPSGPDPYGGYGADGSSQIAGSTAANSGPAMDCSGRGMCDYSSGTCSCFTGFFGTRCESISSLV